MPLSFGAAYDDRWSRIGSDRRDEMEEKRAVQHFLITQTLSKEQRRAIWSRERQDSRILWRGVQGVAVVWPVMRSGAGAHARALSSEARPPLSITLNQREGP